MADLAELAARRAAQKPSNGVRPIDPSRNAQKILNVANKFGAKGIANQQATTRVIYDSIKLAAGPSTVLTFFQNASTRKYPLTNLQENKLQEGEALSLDKLYLAIVMTAVNNPLDVRRITPLASFSEFQGLYASEMDLIFDKSTVLTRYPIASNYAPFNTGSKFSNLDSLGSFCPQDVKEMDSDLVLPPLMVFKAQLEIPTIAAFPLGFDFYLRMSFEGLGTIFSAKGTF